MQKSSKDDFFNLILFPIEWPFNTSASQNLNLRPQQTQIHFPHSWKAPEGVFFLSFT